MNMDGILLEHLKCTLLLQLFTADPWAAAKVPVCFGEPEYFYLC